jgi:hypothetical protein
VHQGIALEVFLLHHPITTLVTVVRVAHERVCATATLVKTIMSETSVTFTHGSSSFLGAGSVAIAIFAATKLLAGRPLLAEAITVAIIAIFAYGAVFSLEVRMALTFVRALNPRTT